MLHHRATRILLAIVGVLFSLYVLEPYVRVYVLSASAPVLLNREGPLPSLSKLPLRFSNESHPQSSKWSASANKPILSA